MDTVGRTLPEASMAFLSMAFTGVIAVDCPQVNGAVAFALPVGRPIIVPFPKVWSCFRRIKP